MATLRREITISAPPQHVWSVIADIGAVHHRLLPGRVTDTRIDGEYRFLTFPDGHVIRELIVTVDHTLRRFVYAVVEGSRPPLTHHHAAFEVHPKDDGTQLIWTTDLLPDTHAPEVGIRMDHGLAEMKRTLESQPQPHPLFRSAPPSGL
ncbi:SRPBCC family protein [Nocardia sp. NPDC003482]